MMSSGVEHDPNQYLPDAGATMAQLDRNKAFHLVLGGAEILMISDLGRYRELTLHTANGMLTLATSQSVANVKKLATQPVHRIFIQCMKGPNAVSATGERFRVLSG